MKQMTKDEMLKIYFRTINDIIALDRDFTRVGETIAYERLMARKELLEGKYFLRSMTSRKDL